MRKILSAPLVLLALMVTNYGYATHLKVGDPAPDFELSDHTGQPVKLSEFKGKRNVVLAFFVLAFTGG